jgi:acetoin utilization protein AcuC
VLVIADEALGRYGFPNGHSFGPDRLGVFLAEFRARGLDARCLARASRIADEAELLRFHTPAHLHKVRERSTDGLGVLDEGDTPAFRCCFEAAARVVGATLDAAQALLEGHARRAFVPIGGLHHATRERAAGFCVFNDIGVLVETLRAAGLRRVAYVDIDAHHGDGVFYPFEHDPFLVVADLHEDGEFLYPGTGRSDETGLAAGAGSKLNLPLPPGADDADFAEAWPAVLAHVEAAKPDFIILQCGTDSLEGDPLAHLKLSAASHRRAASSLAQVAENLGHGRLLALGGGGYNRANIAAGWNAVVEALLEA